MTAKISAEDSNADDVMQIGLIPLSLCHIAGDIHPKGILCNAVLKILTMEIYRVPFKLNPQETDKLHALSIISLRFCDELNQAYV